MCLIFQFQTINQKQNSFALPVLKKSLMTAAEIKFYLFSCHSKAIISSFCWFLQSMNGTKLIRAQNPSFHPTNTVRGYLLWDNEDHLWNLVLCQCKYNRLQLFHLLSVDCQAWSLVDCFKDSWVGNSVMTSGSPLSKSEIVKIPFERITKRRFQYGRIFSLFLSVGFYLLFGFQITRESHFHQAIKSIKPFL